jgi:hypothetical protein
MIFVPRDMWKSTEGQVYDLECCPSVMLAALKEKRNFAIPDRRFERSLAWERFHFLLRSIGRAISPMFMRVLRADERFT